MEKQEIVEKKAGIMTAEEFSRQWADFQEFVKKQLVKNVDYGKVPGIKKPFLMLPGAEKILSRYYVYPEFEFLSDGKLEDWDKGLFCFEVKCILRSIRTGGRVGEGVGSCNSWEEKYRYIWVQKEAIGNRKPIEQRERSGRYGKWIEYKIKREDMATLHNTILKIAKKRAMVNAASILGNASGLFNQDIDIDIDIEESEKPKDGKKIIKSTVNKCTQEQLDEFATLLEVAAEKKKIFEGDLEKSLISWTNHDRSSQLSRNQMQKVIQNMKRMTGKKDADESIEQEQKNLL